MMLCVLSWVLGAVVALASSLGFAGPAAQLASVASAIGGVDRPACDVVAVRVVASDLEVSSGPGAHPARVPTPDLKPALDD